MHRLPFIPQGRGLLLLFVCGILLVVLGTLELLPALAPSLASSDWPLGVFRLDLWQSAGLFLLGFALVSISQVLSAPPEVPDSPRQAKAHSGALDAEAPESIERVHQAVTTKLNPKKRGVGHALALFTISLLLFAYQLDLEGGLYFQWIVALLVVLFVHELGHLVTMHALGYTQLRLFFIPLFGAAASGRKHDATATQRALVALMGPAPALVLALVATFFGPFESRFLHDLVQLGLIVNAFNLLPFVPLDGGIVLDATLFVRWPRSRQVLVHAGGLALATIGFLLDAWIVVGLGLFTFFTAGSNRILGKVASDLRERLDARATASFTPPIEAIPAAIASANEHVFSKTQLTPTPKRYANVIVGAWPEVRARPPRLAPTLRLLGAYAACFAVVLVALTVTAVLEAKRGSYSWHPGGQLHSLGRTDFDGPEGEWHYWHANGSESAVGNYLFRSKQGPWTYWHADGTLESEGSYDAGEKVGLWQLQSETGVRTTRDFGTLPAPGD